MFKRMLLRSSILLVMLGGMQRAGAQAQVMEADVVYEAPELLTKSMLRKHAQLLQILLDIRYTPEQTARHYRFIKQYWERRDNNGIISVKANVRFYDRLAQLPPDEFRVTVESMRPSLLRVLLEEAEVREDSRWFLQTYYIAHPMEAKRNQNAVLTGIIHNQKEEQ